ncbi:MAG: metallophosphoesterase [Candidatus Heimdallarchaeota archaeon]|nr:metallophosphoesterase [Candidatus Heimdallarchaeota archaeon]MCK5049375.1 metallophosphoesterase [Candidatus Heimdallarchaeota archaeon]
MHYNFIAISDIHEDLDAIGLLLEKANSFETLHALFVAGDLSFGDTSKVLEELSRFPCPVIIVFGNHDEYLSFSEKESWKEKNVHILYTGEFFDFTFSEDNKQVSTSTLRVIGFPYPIFDPWCNIDFNDMPLDPWITLENQLLTSFDEGFEPNQIIILAHAPPKQTVDRVVSTKKSFTDQILNIITGKPVSKSRFVGDPNLRDLLIRHQVQLVLCGHIHEEGGKNDYLGECIITNISSLWEVDPWHPGSHYSMISVSKENKYVPHISFWYL